MNFWIIYGIVHLVLIYVSVVLCAIIDKQCDTESDAKIIWFCVFFSPIMVVIGSVVILYNKVRWDK